MDLDSYAQRAESFLTELDREYHLHFSGQKPEYEVEAVYERHAGLFGRETVLALREQVEASEGEARRRASYLLELAVGGYLGRASAAEEAAVAREEAELSLRVGGEEIPYRAAPVAQANEEKRERRAEIEEQRMALLEERLNPLHLVALERTRELLADLGWRSYAEAYGELRGIDLEELAAQTRSFLEATEGVYEGLVDPELRGVLGYGLGEAGRADLPRFFRAPGLDGSFPAERLIPSFTETMAGLGLDLAAQPNIVFDTESRPTKTPRAYCAPVRVPAEVYLVVPRVGGREDFAALFHEGGHAEHYANADGALPVEYRYLGDNSVTESFAFLLEHLTEEPGWIGERLGSRPGAGGCPREGGPPLLPAALRGEALLRAGAPRRGGGALRRCRIATRSCSGRRRAFPGPRRAGSTTSMPASTLRPTCAPGRSRCAGGRTCASASASAGGLSRRLGSGLSGCGARASGCPLMSCSPNGSARSSALTRWPPSSPS